MTCKKIWKYTLELIMISRKIAGLKNAHHEVSVSLYATVKKKT